MPLVFASRSAKVDDELFMRVRDALPGIIAQNLDVPENMMARLVPDDIEIRHLGSPFDIGHFDVEVTILATKFEARIETGQLRSDRMQLDLETMLPDDMTCFVWLILVDAFFSASAKKDPRKLKVMLLESDPEVREEVGTLLERKGFDVLVHSDPEGISVVGVSASSFKPDVVVMGWRRFGPRFVTALKDLGCQVWIFSADSEVTVRREGGEKADHILSKYHDWEKLAEMLAGVKI
ncbi:MAG: hypothetical protein HY471_02370 [Candidatus Sungbacteria bacterium]|nr:hypothetical protein [Candidatus Sungbacteria bacterium]